MVAHQYGGETPQIKYGTELTLETPDGISESAPQLQGDLFKVGGPAADGTQLKAVPLVAADDPNTCIMVQALTRETKPDRPAGYKVINGYGEQIRRMRYVSGAAPALGQSIEASATDVRKVAGQAWARGAGMVVAVNTSALEVEVLC